MRADAVQAGRALTDGCLPTGATAGLARHSSHHTSSC